jgi:putative phage-type endonuclease
MLNVEQLAARRKYLGSSDTAAVLELDPYRSPSDVWMDKTGRAEPFAGNDATERGNLMEPMLVTFAERKLGLKLHRNQFLHGRTGCLCANIDAMSLDPSAVIEAKTSVLADEWGEPGTDQVPTRVTVQVHHQMYVVGPHCRIAYVPVLIAGYRDFDFRMYAVERDDEIANQIAAKATEFWEKYVVTDTPPTGFRPSLEVLKRVRREPGKTADIDMDLWEADIAAQSASKLAEEAADTTRAALLTALGDAEAGRLADGRVFTYLEQNQRRIDSDALRAKFPDAAAACTKVITFRKFQAPKKSKAARPALLSA